MCSEHREHLNAFFIICLAEYILRTFLQTLCVQLPTSLFYIERDPHSRTEIGERDTLVVHKNEATVAWPEAIVCHKPRRQSGVIKAHPSPLIVHSHGQKSVVFRKSG
jgi:hypothetical protein